MSIFERFNATAGAAAVVTVMTVVAVYLLYQIYLYERERTEHARFQHDIWVQSLREGRSPVAAEAGVDTEDSTGNDADLDVEEEPEAAEEGN